MGDRVWWALQNSIWVAQAVNGPSQKLSADVFYMNEIKNWKNSVSSQDPDSAGVDYYVPADSLVG